MRKIIEVRSCDESVTNHFALPISEVFAISFNPETEKISVIFNNGIKEEYFNFYVAPDIDAYDILLNEYIEFNNNN